MQYLKRHKRLQYLITCFSFGLAFIIVLTLGLTHRYDTNQKITKLYQKIDLSSNEMILTKRIYNPENHLYRLDFYIQSEGGENTDNRFLADKLTVNNVSPKDPTKKLPTTLIRVTPQYYVMYVKDVPTEMMRTQLNYTPSFTDSNNEEMTEDVKFYSSSEDTSIQKHLRENKNKNELEADSLDYQVYVLNQQKEKANKQINDKKETVTSLEKEIKSINKELEFEIGEEKEDSLERLENMKNNISDAKAVIKNEEQKLKEVNQQIELLHQQKQMLLKK